MAEENNIFFSPCLGRLRFQEVMAEVFSFISNYKKDRFRLIIGTDSKNSFRGKATFVSILAVHRIGKGGRFFWQRTHLDKIFTMRHRIWQEVNLSLALAQKTIFAFKTKNFFDPLIPQNLEIHVDIGTKGETREMISELVSYVEQNGFQAKIKPDSFGASIVADRFCG